MDRATLGRWRGTAFMAGGAAIAAGLPLIYLVRDGGGGAAFVVAALLFLLGAAGIVVGLLGLRPLFVEHAPKLARAGAGTVTVFAGLTVLALLVIGVLTLIGGGEGSGLPEAPEFGIATAPLFGAIISGHVIFGLASWRSQVPSRRFGGLFVALALLWVVAFVVGMRSMEFDVWDLLAFEVPALGTVLAGYLLREERPALRS